MPASNQSECDANADGAFIDPTQLTILDKLMVGKKSDLARKKMIEKSKSMGSDKKKQTKKKTKGWCTFSHQSQDCLSCYLCEGVHG